VTYEVQTEVYQGPFDLLLDLILKEQVDLWEVPIARIVDAFLAEVDRRGIRQAQAEPTNLYLDLDTATRFLLVAATLVDLKARRLLPQPESVDLDEELLRFEERDLLLGRLLECKTFKDAATALETMVRRAGRSVARAAGPEEPFRSLQPDPFDELTLAKLTKAAAKVFAPPPPEPTVDLYHVTPVKVTVREAIEVVLALLPDRADAPFRDLALGAESRVEVVVRFLAVLELFKQGYVDLDQVSTFGELRVRRLAEGEDLDVIDLEDWDEPTIDLTATPDVVTEDA